MGFTMPRSDYAALQLEDFGQFVGDLKSRAEGMLQPQAPSVPPQPAPASAQAPAAAPAGRPLWADAFDRLPPDVSGVARGLAEMISAAGGSADEIADAITAAQTGAGAFVSGLPDQVGAAIGGHGEPADYGNLGPSTAPGAATAPESLLQLDRVQSPNTGNPLVDAAGTAMSGVGTAVSSGLEPFGGVSERFPTGGPLAGPAVGGVRAGMGYEQMGREGAAEAARRLVDLLDRRDRGEHGLDAQIEYWTKQYDRATSGDVYAAAQRHPDIGRAEFMAQAAQGVASAAIAPSAGAGLARNVAAGAVDPGGAVFNAVPAAGRALVDGAGDSAVRALGSREPAAATGQFASTVGGGAAGGVAGNALTPEDAPLEGRIRNIGVGAAVGAAGGFGAASAAGLRGNPIDYNALAQMRQQHRQAALAGRKTTPTNPADKVIALTINNILSSTTSFFTNTIGGAIETVKRPAITTATAGVKLATRDFRGARSELGAAGADVLGMAHAFGDALADAGHAFTTGERATREYAADAFSGKAGIAATPFLRAMAAFDEFMDTLNGAGAQAAELVRRMHKNPGMSQQQVMQTFQKDLQEAAEHGGMAVVFAEGGTGFGRWLGTVRGQLADAKASPRERVAGLIANVLVPFSAVPDVILTKGTQAIPGVSEAVGVGKVAYHVAKGNPDAAKREVAGRLLISVTNGVIFSQVLAGNVTGNGPSDFEKRKALMNAKDANGRHIWQPNSIRVGDNWVSYSSLGPIALQLGSIANAVEQYEENGRRVDAKMAEGLSKAMLETVSEAWYIQGISSILQGIKYGYIDVNKLTADLASRAIPEGGLINEVRQFTDPTMREPKSVGERLANRVPGLSESVPPQIDAGTGKPVASDKSLLTAVIRTTGKGEPNPTNEALARHDLGVEPSRTISQNGATIELTAPEQREFAKLLGAELDVRVKEAIKNESYKKDTPEGQRRRLQTLINQARASATSQTFKALPLDERKRRIAEYGAKKSNIPQYVR